ncbi:MULTISPECIES: hypothetical protein [Stenotrophomonas]|uniref:hypothetical protein n=1 Tax=Stenotrophomonas TaxID=40323 RepID=UPI001F09F436|nr:MULTISPECIES: hypothetical protein [Stenotrophomonas]
MANRPCPVVAVKVEPEIVAAPLICTAFLEAGEATDVAPSMNRVPLPEIPLACAPGSNVSVPPSEIRQDSAGVPGRTVALPPGGTTPAKAPKLAPAASTKVDIARARRW